MPVKLTERGALILHYQDKEWKRETGLKLEVLKHPVSIDPGVTLKHLIEIVAASEEIKRYVEAVTGCDIDELNSRVIDPDAEPPRLHSDVKMNPDGSGIPVDPVDGDTLFVHKRIDCYTTEGAAADWIHAYVTTRDLWDGGTGQGGIGVHFDFSSLMKLDLAVDRKLQIWGVAEGDREMLFQGVYETNLDDFLVGIFSDFGTPAYSSHEQSTIDGMEAIDEDLEAFREFFHDEYYGDPERMMEAIERWAELREERNDDNPRPRRW